ncbi:MAG TPA: T9SS type A sorting domain-containing protein, partial [Bacteroidia bacterium]
SMTVILVNRALTATHTTHVNLANFAVSNGSYVTKQISGLPSAETFMSHTNNALHTGTTTVTSNTLSISLPALSTTAIILKGAATTGISQVSAINNQVNIYPNPTNGSISIQSTKELAAIVIYNSLGEIMLEQTMLKTTIDISSLQNGVYFITLKDKQQQTISTQKIVVQH